MNDRIHEEYYCMEGIDELEEAVDEVLRDIDKHTNPVQSKYYSDELDNIVQSSTAELTEVFHA